MAIKDYNTDPDLNVQISGINIAEGCPPSGINNAIRQLMADVKAEQDVRGEEWATQAAKDDEQDAAIAEAQSSAEAAVSELSTELGALGAQVGALETEVEGKADAEVDGKGVVRTVNGVSADADGAVTIGVTKVSWPDWTAKINASGGSVKNTAPSDGWVCWGHVASTAATQFYLNDIQLGAIWGHSGGWGDSCAICVPVTKGDIYYCTGTPTWFYFVPCKGA